MILFLYYIICPLLDKWFYIILFIWADLKEPSEKIHFLYIKRNTIVHLMVTMKDILNLLNKKHFLAQMTSYMWNNGGVELISHMWTYEIHSKNAKMIKYLEDTHVLPARNDYKQILRESIMSSQWCTSYMIFFLY